MKSEFGAPITAFEDLEYIEIDYQPGKGDPARVFRAMARLIEAFCQIDRDLAGSVSVTIEPVLVLERIEGGSIRAVLRRMLRALDDDALRNLDWKPLIGQYLVRGKHRLLGWLGEQKELPRIGDVRELQNDLVELVPSDALEGRLLAEPIPSTRLLTNVQQIAEGIQHLANEDNAIYFAGGESTGIRSAFGITTEDIESLLTDEVVSSTTELILLIKKPDYLGTSRWEFRYEDHAIEAKILDEVWLQRFHDGTFALAAGDALRALVRTEMSRGFDGNIVGTRYFVEEVLAVIRGDHGKQMSLLPPPSPST